MATHSSILAWEISWTEEPGGLQSMGLKRVGQESAHTHSIAGKSDNLDKQRCKNLVLAELKF